MATGDITVTVRPDGWSLDLYIEGFIAGATYAFGLATNNIPGTSTPYLTVVSEGYNDAGTLGTISRTVYLTSTVRVPYSTSTQAGGTWSGIFQDGETITCSTSGATAVIVGNQSSGAVLRYRTLSGTPLNGQTWTGGTSGATFVNTTNTVTTLAAGAVDELVGSAGLTVRIALSDYVYLDDNTGAGKSGTAPMITIPAVFATNTAGASQTSNALTAAAVTQNSTLVYPKVTANWSWPGYQLLTSTSKLRAVAFSTHAQFGRPVRVVKFTLTDGSTTNTEYVTAATYDPTVGDALPVVEYVTTSNMVSGLTAKAEVTGNFIAYPWVGDADSILDTSTGTAAPTPLFGPIKGVCDNAATYESTCALVDDTGGSDVGANTVYPASSFDPTTAYKFATIGKAAAAIAAYNNTNYSRNDGGAGVVYLADGNYVWAGSSNSYGTTPKTWLTVTRAANSTNRAAVVITSANNDKALGGRTKLTDLTITSSTAIQHTGEAALWFDQCDINYTGSALVYSNGTTTWATRNTLTSVAGGFGPYTTATSTLALLRGNTITTSLTCPVFFTVLGNNRHTTTQTSTLGISSVGVAFADNKIYAFNRWMKVNNSNPFQIINVAVSRYAVVQNIFEAIGTTSGPLTSLFADGGTTGDALNVIVWHNVTVGQRINQAYCSTGANNPLRVGWSVKNNITDDYALKTDTYTGDGGAHGMRTGNWSQVYSVGSSGNVYQAVTNITANSSAQEFWGLKTLRATSVAATYIAYTNRLAWIGTGGAATGNGTYTLTSTSPAIEMQRDQVLPFDLNGTVRSQYDAAGAYHYGTKSGDFLNHFQL